MERTVNNHQVTLQERHPRPEKLVASVVEARHITNGRDVSREDPRGSQNIRALGGVRRSKVPSRARTSITADIEKFPDPSKSKRDVAAGSPPIYPTHIAFTHLPSSTHSALARLFLARLAQSSSSLEMELRLRVLRLFVCQHSSPVR